MAELTSTLEVEPVVDLNHCCLQLQNLVASFIFLEFLSYQSTPVFWINFVSFVDVYPSCANGRFARVSIALFNWPFFIHLMLLVCHHFFFPRNFDFCWVELGSTQVIPEFLFPGMVPVFVQFFCVTLSQCTWL